MSYYLDINARRIQTWLARTTDLRERTGASNVLCTETARDRIVSELSGAGVWWNDEAGDVDGVISLRFEPTGGEGANAAAQRISRGVIGRLQQTMPTLGFEAVWADAETYADAAALLRAKAGRGEFSYDAAGLNIELVMAMRCPECAQHPASPARAGDGRFDDERVAPCAECRAKRSAARETTALRDSANPNVNRATRLRATRTERALRAAYGAAASIPAHFAALAGAEDSSQTHLALIYADGNRIGALVSAAAANGRGKRQIAEALQTATSEALVAAVADDRGDMIPTIPHLVGGDDILLSVPALRGWRVARRFAATFSEKLRLGLGQDVVTAVPTVSAGLLFHHYSEPFAYALERCDELLDQAKKSQRGETATIAFADLTFDGEDVRTTPSDRCFVRTVGWLTQHRELLNAAATSLSTSQRYSLYELTRDIGGTSGQPPGPFPELGRKIVDQSNTAFLRVLVAAGCDVRQMARRPVTALEADVVREVLALLRWWRS